MALDNGIRGSEGVTSNENSFARAASDAYRQTEVREYRCIITTTASPDSQKTDDQLNNILNNREPIYGCHDTTDSAITDLQKGIKSDGRTRHNLMDAIADAQHGDLDGAMAHLREASGNLNAAGGNIDSGLSQLGDGGHSRGSQIIQRGMVNEADCTENIQKAQQLLREGDAEGAIKAMQKGIREIAHRQHATRDGISSLQGDDSYGEIDWRNLGPQGYQNGSGDTSYYPGYNRGDSQFDNQQHVDRSGNDNWDSGLSRISGSISGLPDPFRLARDMGLPVPPNLTDFLGGGGLPNPGDFLGGGGLPNPGDFLGGGGLPNPGDFLGGGGLPNPGDFLGGGGLPNPGDLLGGGGLPNPGDFLGSGGLPNPGDLLGGGGLPNPGDFLGNLFGGGKDKDGDKKDGKDLVHKILDPIGLFG